MQKPKLIRITTIPLSMDKLLEGQLNYMSEFYDIIAVSADNNGYLERVAEREGVKFYPVELTRAITPAADLLALKKLTEFLRKEKPEIVHSHTPKAGTIGMLAARLAGVPVRLHTVAGLPLLEAGGAKRKLLNAVEKITYAAATRVLPNSQGLKEIILKEGFAQNKKLNVIGEGSSNGIDTSFFDPLKYNENQKMRLRNELAIQNDDFVFIFVGRLVKDKGINELIKAFTALNSDKIKLLLVGNMEPELDPLEPDTIQRIRENQHIISVGWQNDVKPYMAVSNALVFPSYREGFPNVVMQAGAMGLPAIVSDINGCNEIIEEGVNGLIVPPKTVPSLAKAMTDMFQDHEKFNSMKSNSRKIITERYERTYVWEELHAFYEHELAAAGR